MRGEHKILESINNQGGFDNFNNWDTAEVVQWIKTNYTCSKKVAKNVAFYLK